MINQLRFSPLPSFAIRFAANIGLGVCLLFVANNSFAWSLSLSPFETSIQAENSRDLVCVTKDMKPGEIVKHPNGTIAQISALLAPDPYTCASALYPIPARMDLVSMTRIYGKNSDLQVSSRKGAQMKINLSDDWSALEFNEGMRKARTTIAFLRNSVLGAEMVVNIHERALQRDVDRDIKDSRQRLISNPSFSNTQISETKMIDFREAKGYLYTAKANANAIPYILHRQYYVSDRYVAQIQVHGPTSRLEPNLEGLVSALTSSFSVDTNNSTASRHLKDAPQITDTQSEGAPKISQIAEEKCEKLGFQKPTAKFWECVLTLGR